MKYKKSYSYFCSKEFLDLLKEISNQKKKQQQ